VMAKNQVEKVCWEVASVEVCLAPLSFEIPRR
jgi:hypothetical protein